MVCFTRLFASPDASESEKERQQGLAGLAHLAGYHKCSDARLTGEWSPLSPSGISGMSTDCEQLDVWSQTSSDDLAAAKDAPGELLLSSRESRSTFTVSGHDVDVIGPLSEALQHPWRVSLDNLLTKYHLPPGLTMERSSEDAGQPWKVWSSHGASQFCAHCGHPSSEAQEMFDISKPNVFCVACGERHDLAEPACSHHLEEKRPEWPCDDVGIASFAEAQTPRDVDVLLPGFVSLDQQPSQRQDKAKHIGHAVPSASMTTVMIRHIPCRYTQEDCMQCLDKAGLNGRYDFVYVPLNSRKRANLGYIFVNLVSAEAVEECKRIFTGQAFGASASAKLCEVSIAHVQGRERLKTRPESMRAKAAALVARVRVSGSSDLTSNEA